jgi:hypothetical protein
MAASYPTSTKSFSTKTNGQTIAASHIDDLQDEVVAIETDLRAGLSAARGGTGVVTLAAHGVLIGNGTSAVAVTAAGTAGQVLTSNGASADPTFQTPSPAIFCDGRLTLTAGTPITVADVTAAATIYFTPYKGNRVSLYDGVSAWSTLAFVETSLVLGTLVNAQAYDVFGYNNSGTLALEVAEWANATITMTIAAPGVVTWTAHGMSTGQSITFTTTGALPTGLTANTQYFVTVVDANTFKLSTTRKTLAAGTFITTSGTQSGVHTGHQPHARQTALTLQDGTYVKSGTTTRRYLGTLLTTATTTTEDSATKRYLWNYYNRVPRSLVRLESTVSWNYTTATVRQANDSASNQVSVIIGLQEVALDLSLNLHASNNNATVVFFSAGIGEDTTLTYAAGGFASSNGAAVALVARLEKYPTIGFHDYLWNEWSAATGTTTMFGAASGVGSTISAGLAGQIAG